MQDRMRATWDDLARRNAMHFISTDRRDWDQAQFLAEGSTDSLFADASTFASINAGFSKT